MKTQTVKLETKELVVKQLPLKKYAKLIGAFEKLPAQLSGLENLSNDDILPKLPQLIAKSFPDVVNVFVVATELTREEVDELSLDEAIDVFIAIIEVNKYKEVFDKLKKVFSPQVKK